ncbi:hypothetical protein WN51_05233 [Melipona quadrifasciata]|uniref:Uncharacterized protein n=1 Tax=Melipona quadrifasciata TaxID=166423 RepID=A0A0M8ZV75_9HYME|nr:hypothetical protein WN51_05233 [Melipona quadrifasciata]
MRNKKKKKKKKEEQEEEEETGQAEGGQQASKWGTGKRRPLRRDQGCKVTLMTQSPAAASGDI